MKVQNIQSTNNISSKAKFVIDSNGHFCRLWRNAVLDTELANLIDNFAKRNKKHSLEITDVLYNDKRKRFSYMLFNHFNGFGLTIETNNSPGFVLHEILEKISKSQIFSDKNSIMATQFKKLTGRKG